MLVRAFKNSTRVVHRVFAYLQDSLLPACFFLPKQVLFSVTLCLLYFLVFSPPFHSLWHMQMLQNALIHSYFISLSHTHTFLVHFFCWACSAWHSFYILIQNVLNGVYLKLQLFKHPKWSLWEVGGMQGMRMKAADDDFYLAHLPLPTKTIFTGLIWPVSGSEQLPTVA